MCELFGMSALHRTDVNHSLDLLRPRGGEIGPHADGWGVAFYEGRHARVFKESRPAARSRCLKMIAHHDYQSRFVVAHIRRANPVRFGRESSNTHPFDRELGGRSWVFAHNGKLPGVKRDEEFRPRHFHPIGDTDSERAFCFLLDRLKERGVGGLSSIHPTELVDLLKRPVARLGSLGEFNFLLSNGRVLIAYADTDLHRVIRRCSDGGNDQRVVLLSTTPLTDESWQSLRSNTLYTFREGRTIDRESIDGGSVIQTA